MHVGVAIRVELLVLAGSLGFSAAVPAGCGASGPGVDGGEPDAISCEELHMRWSGEVGAIDRSCTIDADCAAFGGGWCTWPSTPLERAAELPAGARAIDEPAPDAGPIVLGLSHTDSNLHVNSLVYPRLFEEAALRRMAALGRPTARLLARRCTIGWRKPAFAGDRLRIVLRAFEHEGRLGAAGVFVSDRNASA